MLPRISDLTDARTPTFTFAVAGKPEAKGSTRAFVPKGWTRPIITSTNRNLKEWEARVRDAALPYLTTVYAAEAIGVHLSFRLERPKSLPKRIAHHCKKPDLDKLVRAVIDGMTGIIYRDDSQVVQIQAEKSYATPGETEGVIVTVSIWETFRGI
jgi:crossover junction endodeoxyribonuclease RusA